MGLDLIVSELGEAFLGLLAGGAVMVMLIGILNYVTGF